MSHISPAHARDSIVLSITKSAESDNTKIALCASLELATCRAENCQLKDKLTECETTIHRLKKLVAKIAEKQVEILAELVDLRKNCGIVPNNTTAEINTLDTSTSTIEDGMLEWDNYMPDWDLFQFSGEASPLASSASTTSELDLLQEDSELDPNFLSWRGNEEEEQEEAEEGDDGEDDDYEGSQNMSQNSQQFMEDHWDEESDN